MLITAVEAKKKRLAEEQQRQETWREEQRKHRENTHVENVRLGADRPLTFSPLRESLNVAVEEAEAVLRHVRIIREAITAIEALPEEADSLALCDSIQLQVSPYVSGLRELLRAAGRRYSGQTWRVHDSVASGIASLRDRFARLVEAQQTQEREAAEKVRRIEAFAAYEQEYAQWLEAGRRGERVGPRPEPPVFAEEG